MSDLNYTQWKWIEPCPLLILALSLQSSIRLCVCLVPPHVISPSGQPPHQTSLQAIPRCHTSIWLCGMSQPFSREGCLTTIRLHPSLLLCFAAISPGPYLSKSTCLCNCLFGKKLVFVVNEMGYYSYVSYRCCYVQLGYNASTRVSWMYYFKDLFRLGNDQGLKYLNFSRIWITEWHFLVISFSSFIFNRSSPCLLFGCQGCFSLWISQCLFTVMPSALSLVFLLPCRLTGAWTFFQAYFQLQYISH